MDAETASQKRESKRTGDAQRMSGPSKILRAKEIQTRFLYPFFFDKGEAKLAYRLLSELRIKARDGQQMAVWDCSQPLALYEEELLDHVDRFLFRDSERGCMYLRLANPVGSRWFNKLEVILSELVPPNDTPVNDGEQSDQFSERKRSTYRVKLVALASIEVFLSNYGVGVLSMAITPNLRDLDFESAALFNYKLSQLRPQVAARLRIPHPSENSRTWEKLSSQQKEKIPSMPATDAPLSERIGGIGSSFLLGELITNVLLQPLCGVGLRAVQNQLSVYTIVRFGDEVDFEKDEIRTALAAFLSGLSQIEEPTHAGAPKGVVSVTNAILNRRHWVGVGLLGMAHIVSDQPAPHLSFNEQRIPRALSKYFIPYLVALLQRTFLQRTISDAGSVVFSHQEDSVAGLACLRSHLLAFALDGYFPEISSREVIHRYYLMIQEALGVRRAFEDARRAISDVDAQHRIDRQVKLAEAMATNAVATKFLQEQMTEHLQVVAKVQVTVEWIEIFLVSVYLAHLWDLFAAHIEVLHRWIPLGVITGAILGAIIAAAVLKPWRHRKPKSA